MKKKTLISILVLILIVSLMILYQKEHRYNLYIMDTEKNTVSQIGDKKYKIDEIVWSNDNQKFLFINEKSNSLMPPYFDNLILCSRPNYKISILPFDLTTNFKYRDIVASFISNDGIYVYRYNSKNQSLYEIRNISSGSRIKIEYMDKDKYKDDDYEKSALKWDMYEIPEQVAAKVREAAGSEYFEAVINYNRDIVVYRTKNHEVYSLDLNSGYIKYLFKGFDVRWSPRGTEITYLTHKSKNIEDLGDYDGGLSNELVTYVYDLKSGKSTKVADFGAAIYFSNDDKYIVFYEQSYMGLRGAI